MDMGIKIIKYLNIFQSNTPSALLIWTIRRQYNVSVSFLQDIQLCVVISMWSINLSITNVSIVDVCFLLPGTVEEKENLCSVKNQQGKTYIGQVQTDCFCQVKKSAGTL
jgi:hypothetical protein